MTLPLVIMHSYGNSGTLMAGTGAGVRIMVEGYMSVSDAAAAMGISVTALYDRIRNGQVKAERIGRRVLVIPEAEVERLRGAGRMKPGPKPGQARDKS